MEILVLTKHEYFYQQEARLQDWLMTRLVRPELPQNYILLAIDEATIKLDNVEPDEIANSRALQEMKKGYPFSRAVYGELIDRLVGAGAKLVIFDLVLRGSKPGDEVLIDAVKRHPGKVLFGSNFDVDDESNSFTYTEPPAEIVEGAAVGLVNFPITLDGVARSMFFKGTPQSIQLEESHKDALTVPSLAGAANRLLGGDTPDTLKPFRFLFSQRLPKKRNVPLYEVFVPALWKANLKDGAVFKDSVVLLGATEAVFQDYHQTPLGRMPGPELQLHQLAALQGHWWLSDFGKPMMFASVILAAMLAYLVVFLRRSMVVFTIIILGGAAFWVLVAMAYLHWQHAFIPVIAPLSTWAVCGFVGIVTQISHERRERKRLRSTLERYVSKDVVKEIVDNPASYLHTLVGQRKEITVLFCDLKGFTASAEDFDPSELVAMLNDYFGEMVSVVFSNQGTIDKFMGDALMAVWGCINTAGPEEDGRRAVRTALAMKARLVELNKRRAQTGNAPWGCGTGICQGPAVFGNIGSDQKMDPTVIGDTVNLASRVEGLTRIYGCDILIDQRLADFARGDCDVIFVDEVRVKGRAKPEKLYHPYERHPDSLAWRDAFAEARIAYVAGDFETARKAYAELVSNLVLGGLATCYLKRCEGFIKDPPEGKWTGIWDFVSK